MSTRTRPADGVRPASKAMPESLNNPERQAGRSESRERLLLVQCCHPPQFLYLTRRLSEQYPDARLDAFVIDHEDVRRVIEKLPVFGRVLLMGRDQPDDVEYDRILFPLINRGYARIKRAALAWRGRRWESGYQGDGKPLTISRLALSMARALHSPPPDFAEFTRKTYPEKNIGRKILVIESCHPSLARRFENSWRMLASPRTVVTTISESGLLENWKKLRSDNFDAAVVFFSGESGFLRLKLLPFLLRCRTILIVNENGDHRFVSVRNLTEFLYQRIRYGSVLPQPRPGVVFIQTESPAVINRALRRLRNHSLFPQAEVLVVCREADRRAIQESGCVDRLITYRPSRPGDWMGVRRAVLDFAPDVVAAVFSGQPVFRKQKLFFLLHADRRQLVFNPELESYWLSPRTASNIFKDQPLRPAVQPDDRAPILFFQTEDWVQTRKALSKLGGPRLYSEARITLVCQASDSTKFEGLPHIERVLTYPESVAQLRALRRRLKKTPFEVSSALFTGRPVFRKQKLLFFLLSSAPRLVFNSQLDCYWLRLATVRNLFRKDKFRVPEVSPAEVLLIQSESASEVREAIEVLKSGQAVGRLHLAVLCSESEKPGFEKIEEIRRFYTYRQGEWGSVVRLLRELGKQERDVVSAILSGRPVFRLPKLLFFLLPARNRLVFNENLDCYYLNRSRLGRRLQLPSVPRSPRRPLHLHSLSRKYSVFRESLRFLVKAVLFVPRFVYLMAWLVVAKLRRVYRLQRGPG